MTEFESHLDQQTLDELSDLIIIWRKARWWNKGAIANVICAKLAYRLQFRYKTRTSAELK